MSPAEPQGGSEDPRPRQNGRVFRPAPAKEQGGLKAALYGYGSQMIVIFGFMFVSPAVIG
jgi:hypothetical protein